MSRRNLILATFLILAGLAFAISSSLATVFEPAAGSNAQNPSFIQASMSIAVTLPTPVPVMPSATFSVSIQNTPGVSIQNTPAVVPNSPSSSSCKTVTVNAQGASGAAITVNNTAGGVTVMAASSTRCSAVIENAGTTNPMLCAPTTITVSGTVGYLIQPSGWITLGLESQQQWKCFSTAGTTADVAEGTT